MANRFNPSLFLGAVHGLVTANRDDVIVRVIELTSKAFVAHLIPKNALPDDLTANWVDVLKEWLDDYDVVFSKSVVAYGVHPDREDQGPFLKIDVTFRVA